MRLFFHLLLKHLLQHPGRSAVGVAVLTVASALMILLATLGAAVHFKVGAHLAQLFPEERLRLEAAKATLGPIALEPVPITDQTVQTLVKLPQVSAVTTVEPLRVPLIVGGDLFGSQISSDAVIYGVEREMVADALAPDQSWQAPASPAQPYPLVASKYFLDLYNLGLARSAGLPMLNPKVVVGADLTVVLGASNLGLALGGREPEVLPAKLMGLTDQPAMLGLAMPAQAVRAINQRYHPQQPAQYVQLMVTLRKGAEREAFMAQAAKSGLVLAGADQMAGQIKKAAGGLGVILIGLACAIFGLGLLTFYLLYAMLFHARQQDFIRLRALGMSPLEVVALALGEVGALSLTSVALALGLNLWGLGRLEGWLTTFQERFSFLPAGLLRFEPMTLPVLAGVLLVLALVPALPLLRTACRRDLAAQIRDL